MNDPDKLRISKRPCNNVFRRKKKNETENTAGPL
jgi:hypothetical protein